MVMEYLNQGYGYFSKGLEFVRGIIIKVAGWLPWEAELSMAILFLILSIFLSYKFICKFTVHPFSTQNIIYLIIQSLMLFVIFMYL